MSSDRRAQGFKVDYNWLRSTMKHILRDDGVLDGWNDKSFSNKWPGNVVEGGEYRNKERGTINRSKMQKESINVKIITLFNHTLRL